jgi:hypothetical protein
MPKEVESEVFLTVEEAAEAYPWPMATLYYFRTLGLLDSYKFVGDRRTYWKVSELEAVKNRPAEATKRGPKKESHLVTAS